MNAKLIPQNGIDKHGYVVELSKAGHIKKTHKKFIEAIIAHLQETFLEIPLFFLKMGISAAILFLPRSVS